MTRAALPALALLCAVGCSGGSSGNSTLPAVVATPQPSPTATARPSAAPSAAATPAATPTPTIAPTAAPTPTATPTQVPLSQRVLGAAPENSTPVLSVLRAPQSRRGVASQGVSASGLPILVESSGSAAIWAGDFITWVGNASAPGTDVAETSGQMTTTNGVVVNSPAFGPLTAAQNAIWYAAHPSAFIFGTTSAQAKPLGAQTLTITYGDGTTGTITDYVYQGWTLPCNTGWVYQAGNIVPTATRAGSDVYADCVGGNIDVPSGFILAQPAQDQFGRYETAFPLYTAQPLFAAANAVIPMSSIGQGAILAIITQDGGFAKVYFTNAPGSTTLTSATGMAMHSQVNGTFAY